VLDATPAGVLLLLVRSLAAALLTALVTRILLLLTGLLLSTMLLAALAALLALLAALLVLVLAHTFAPVCNDPLPGIILAQRRHGYSRNMSSSGGICSTFEPRG
jgi:hypothetical protein